MMNKIKILIMYKILIIGTTTGKYGGTNVSLIHLLNYFKEEKINYKHLETGGVRQKNINSLFLFIKLLISLIKYSKKSKTISAHLNNTALPILGPFLYLVSKLLKKPYTIRIFGGFGYENKNRLIRFINFKVLQNSKMYFAQTKKLYKIAIKDNLEVTWFPTTRPKTNLRINSSQSKNLVYIGRIIKEKGIFEIIKAAKLINSNISIDIYGPLQNGLNQTIFDEGKNINYKGVVNPKNIYETLVNYDLLLFPTYYPGEGYPGIIIEALNVGMPTICTDWLAMKDILDKDSTIFIDPKNHISLANAIDNVFLNKKLYKDLCLGAKKRGQLFDMENLYNNYIKFHFNV
jgi:glycosyltransferase involved in cell wall biosynthesis